jgi:phage anti-repressor protein
MKGLRKLFKWFENTMSAVAFAEAGEFETAREMMREEKHRDRKVKRDYTKRVRMNAAGSSR